jgi:hypothetical protein
LVAGLISQLRLDVLIFVVFVELPKGLAASLETTPAS